METVIPKGLSEQLFGSKGVSDSDYGVARFISFASDGMIKVSTT